MTRCKVYFEMVAYPMSHNSVTTPYVYMYIQYIPESRLNFFQQNDPYSSSSRLCQGEKHSKRERSYDYVLIDIINKRPREDGQRMGLA